MNATPPALTGHGLLWDGHGFDGAETHMAWQGPPSGEAERRRRDAERERLRDEDRRRNAVNSAALERILRFDRPGRSYYLLEGSVRAVTRLRYPYGADWRNPDLFWPDDRRWFVATDLDFWSRYIGGPSGFIAEVPKAVPRSEPVALDLPLQTED